MDEIPNPGAVTFNDVAVCFSQRDWQLLADWQRRLYRNAMKEIHGALATLGYEIANPGILVRIQQPEGPYRSEELAEEETAAHAWASHRLHRQGSMAATLDAVPKLPPVRPDILLRVKMENATSEQDSQTSAPRMTDESEDSNSAVFNPDLALWIKQEDEGRCDEFSSPVKEERPPTAVEGTPAEHPDSQCEKTGGICEAICSSPYFQNGKCASGPCCHILLA